MSTCNEHNIYFILWLESRGLLITHLIHTLLFKNVVEYGYSLIV